LRTVSELIVRDNPSLKPGFGSRAWRKALLRHDGFQSIASGALYQFMRMTHATQRNVSKISDPWPLVEPHIPAIIALWHGQHFMVPFMWPKGKPVDALISKNADAEINARVLSRMGVRTVRGSGGRDERQNINRGGAKALLELRRSLAEGRSVVMIADISHRHPRQAGEGVVALARISGRPIIAAAYATSNRYVFKSSWDQATLNLPFGKRGFAVGEPIFVTPDDDTVVKQRQVTDALNEVTTRAALEVGLAGDNVA
jgi:lysophospholipid acyltransferase (LPLAT)-like uncharacterized protein